MGAVVLRSIEDLRRYNRELAARRVEDDPVVRKLLFAKQVTWLAMLEGSFLCYHLADRLQEALYILG
jgi:hypothetical protein